MNNIPVVISDLVLSLRNPSTPKHVKFNQAILIEQIVKTCQAALDKYNGVKPKKQGDA